MAQPDPGFTAQLASHAKDLLTVAACAAGGLVLLAAIATPLVRLVRAKRVTFGLAPFTVGPGLNPDLKGVLHDSLLMELQRAAVLLNRPLAPRARRPQAGDQPGGAAAGGKLVATPEDGTAGPPRPEADERGKRYFRTKAAVRRIPPWGMGDAQTNAFRGPPTVGVSGSPGAPDVADAVTLDGGGTKIAVLRLYLAVVRWAPVKCRNRVTGHLRRAGDELRLTAEVSETVWERRQRARRAERNPEPRPSRSGVARVHAPGEPEDYTCAADLRDPADLEKVARGLGADLAFKLLAGALRAEPRDAAGPVAEWRALKHYVEAAAAYEAASEAASDSHGRALLHAAVKDAAALSRLAPHFPRLAALVAAVSQACLELGDVDAAERAPLALYPHIVGTVLAGTGAGPAADSKVSRRSAADDKTRQGPTARALVRWRAEAEAQDRRRAEADGRADVLCRLGLIWVQKTSFERAVPILRLAHAVAGAGSELEPSILAHLAAALAGSERIEDQEKAVQIVRGEASGRLERPKDAAALCEDADRLATIYLFEHALEDYRSAAEQQAETAYLSYRCGVMCRYLAQRVPEEDQEERAARHLKEAERYLRAASERAGRAELLPGLRGGDGAVRDGRVDAWYAVEALNDLGVLLLEKKELEEARRTFVSALEHAPGEWDILNNLALTHQRLLERDDRGARGEVFASADTAEHYALACSLYGEAVALAPRESVARLNLALLLERAGAHDAARLHFAEARANICAAGGAHAREDATACAQGEARVLERLGRVEEAIKALRSRTDAEDTDNPDLELYLAILTLKRGALAGERHFDASLRHVWRARSFIGTDAQHAQQPAALVARADEIEGYIRRWMGQPGAAGLFFSRAAASSEPSEYALASLALLAHEAGDRERACEYKRQAEVRASERRNHTPTSASYRACLAALVGNKEAALRHLGEALAWEPGAARWVRIDPDYGRLAGDRRFEALVGRRAASAAMGPMGSGVAC